MMFKVFNCHNYHELKNKFQVSKIGLLAQWVKFQKIFKDKTYNVSIVDIWFLISPLSWCFCVEQS